VKNKVNNSSIDGFAKVVNNDDNYRYTDSPVAQQNRDMILLSIAESLQLIKEILKSLPDELQKVANSDTSDESR
jgi:hypothetical protein